MKGMILGMCFGLLLSACEERRSPCVYEMPASFRGWVLIVFNQTNCPSLPVRDGHRIFTLGPDGRLRTSSSLETGWAKDEFYFAADGKKKVSATVMGQTA